MYYKNYQNRQFGKAAYSPRKPVKSFHDLEVYQITAGLAAVIAKRVVSDQTSIDTKSKKKEAPADDVKTAIDGIFKKLLSYALDIPIQLTIAHSWRFGHGRECLNRLEKAMLECNLATAYLEQYRDIVLPAAEIVRPSGSRSSSLQDQSLVDDFFEECIKKYLAVRGKILRLERSWAKFIELNQEENK